jgi:hypothetical protein
MTEKCFLPWVRGAGAVASPALNLYRTPTADGVLLYLDAENEVGNAQKGCYERLLIRWRVRRAIPREELIGNCVKHLSSFVSPVNRLIDRFFETFG